MSLFDDFRSVSVAKKQFGFVVVGLIVLTFSVLAWQRFMWVTTTEGWHYTVVQENMNRITSLARLPEGDVVATLSPKQKAGGPAEGQLIQLENANTSYRVLATQLHKPDGLLAYDGGIVATQEWPNQPVLYWYEGEMKSLMDLNAAESIAITAKGKWLIVEDSANGRLLEIDPETHQQKTLYQGFEAGEGVCIGRDHRIFILDNKRNELLEFVNGDMKSIADGLYHPGFLLCTDDGIWITEDVTSRGRLWFYDYAKLQVIAHHLHSPQGVLLEKDHSILVAEQGRSRLLRFMRE